MPPRKPAAGKQSAEARYRAYTRKDGTRVKGHSRTLTRQAQITRTKEAWIGFGFSGLTALAIVLEASVTIVMSLAMVAIVAFGWLLLAATGKAEEIKKKQRAARKGSTRRTRPTSRTRSSTRSRR